MMLHLKLKKQSLTHKLMVAVFLLAIVVISLIAIPQYSSRTSDFVRRTGTWNGFNGHMLVVEFSNRLSKRVKVDLVMKDQTNEIIGSEEIVISGKGTSHTILNKYPVQDAYGTFEITTSNEDSSLSSRIITYRMDKDNVVQYATSSALEESLRGPTYGVYNSMNPDGTIINPVYNWLTIYNPGERSFRGRVLLRSQDGTPLFDRQISIDNISPGGRMDYAVGHPDGQRVGIYEVIPEDPNQKYGAFLSRYSEVTPGVFSFSMMIPSSSGILDSGMVPASTMGPAINWAEIANISSESVSIDLEVFNRNGEALYVTRENLSPYAQFHEYLNKHIGELNVGFFRVRSSAKVLVQSLYYGQDPDDTPSINWAYNTSGGFSRFREGIFPINTNLNAPNWLKVFAGSLHNPEQIRMRIFDREGSEIALDNGGYVEVSGSVDIALHEYLPSNFTGSLKLTSENPIQAQVIRVFTGGGSKAVGRAMRAKGMEEISGRKSGGGSIVSTMLAINPFDEDDEDEEDEAPPPPPPIPDEDDTFDEPIEVPTSTPDFYKVCDPVSHECKQVLGKGVDQCSSDTDCGRLECDFDGYCSRVPVLGEDQCSFNKDCGHRECDSEGYCSQFPGTGPDRCRSDGDCGYRVCDNELGTCNQVPGEGEDECQRQIDCKHEACNDDGICVLVPGQGEDECFSADDCSHRECSPEGFCKRVLGKGDHLCKDDSECGKRVCNFQKECVQIPVLGESDCSTHRHCGGVKVCSLGQCEVIRRIGGESDQCSENKDCPQPPPSVALLDQQMNCPGPDCDQIDLASRSLEDEIRVSSVVKAANKRARLGSENATKKFEKEMREAKYNNESAKVHLEIFQDVNCGMCKYAYQNMIKDYFETYVSTGLGTLEIKEFPLIPRKDDLKEARALICASDQGKYGAFLDNVYSLEKKNEKRDLDLIARQVSLDIKEFKACIDSGATESILSSYRKEADSRKINGTPTIFLNGSKIGGAMPFEKLKGFIEEVLQ